MKRNRLLLSNLRKKLDLGGDIWLSVLAKCREEREETVKNDDCVKNNAKAIRRRLVLLSDFSGSPRGSAIKTDGCKSRRANAINHMDNKWQFHKLLQKWQNPQKPFQ